MKRKMCPEISVRQLATVSSDDTWVFQYSPERNVSNGKNLEKV
jgi:hypothetical protein